jgi:phospholipid/cholesterol/gamma-HCH transport system substrate-binding protein
MAKRVVNNAKLGVFVLASLLFLVLLLYMIGKNRNMFGSTYELKARFNNAQGLVVGNNVRFSGIAAGTVKKMEILNDTSIEVTMIMDKKMLPIIRNNAIASVGTEGLVGNKIVNIVPARQPGLLAKEGEILQTLKAVNTDDILQTLFQTNNDVAVIAGELKTTVQRINKSQALWTLLNDQSLPRDVRFSLANIRDATSKAGKMVQNLNLIVSDIKQGKGSVGMLLKDTLMATNLNDAIVQIKSVGDEANALVNNIDKMVASIKQDIEKGKGPVNALLRDSLVVVKLNAILDNIEQGTDGFSQNMEALKHNIFFRGYFRRLEKQKKKEEEERLAKKN